jgi:hypothetical protein
MICCSSCFLWVSVRYVLFRSCTYLVALNLCSVGLQDSRGMSMSVLVGFLYISNLIGLFYFLIVMSKKCIRLFCSLSVVKFNRWEAVLKLFRTSEMSVLSES